MKTLLSSFGYLKEFFCFHDRMVRKMMLHVKKQKWKQVFPFIDEIEIKQWEQANPHTAIIPKEKRVLMEGDSIPFVPFVLSGSIRVYKMNEQGREVTLYRVKKEKLLMVTSMDRIQLMSL